MQPLEYACVKCILLKSMLYIIIMYIHIYVACMQLAVAQLRECDERSSLISNPPPEGSDPAVHTIHIFCGQVTNVGFYKNALQPIQLILYTHRIMEN